MLKASRLLWILLIFGAFMAFGNDRAEAETALASWYGPGFDGQLTASGEVFDAHGYTAARSTSSSTTADRTPADGISISPRAPQST